jgi:hypothetical protein
MRASSATSDVQHELVVNGLTPATTYRYTVKIDDGRTSEGSVTTAPEDDRAIDFVVYGDNRDGTAVHASLVDRIRATPASFLVQTGDMVANGNDADDWSRFFSIERELLRDRCLFPVIGNHEIASPVSNGARRYAEFFRLPSPPGSSERYYTFRWGNVRFFMLDAQNDFLGDERDWLEKSLTDADGEAGVRWRFVVLHHGPYSSGLHGPNKAMNAEKIPAMLVRHKVDLVLAGHDHIYERGLGDEGLRYVISGGGGAPLYQVHHDDPHAQRFEAVNHFLAVSTSSTETKLRAIRLDGSILEACSFAAESPAAGWKCDGAGATGSIASAPAGGASAATTRTATAGSTTPTKSGACGCEVGAPAHATRAPIAATVALVAATIASMRGSRRRARQR